MAESTAGREPLIIWASSAGQLQQALALPAPVCVLAAPGIPTEEAKSAARQAGFRCLVLGPDQQVTPDPGVVYLAERDSFLFVSGQESGSPQISARNNCPDREQELSETNDALREANELHERRAMQLAESNAELERFAYIASHDLQEPLRMVTSFLQLLKKRYHAQLDETAMQYVDFAVDGAERMKRLIHDLLEYSRLGSNKEDVAPVDLNLVMYDVTSMFTESMRETGAAIDIGLLPVVHGKKVQLMQLFQNLISNAIKYRSSEPLMIRIRATEEPAHWRFEVTDNGIGIDPRFKEKIFIIFQRLHSKSEYSGTGIGLAICKKIVERHGGKIDVESQPGKGSTFIFTIAKS